MSDNVSVFATGLNNPRELKFGADSALYVAEGGTGGAMGTTEADCAQVVAPIGPYTGDMNGRISKVDQDGTVTTVAEGFPSSQTAATVGSLVSGVADVAWVDGTLHALVTAAGCSHGLKDTVNGVYRVNDDGTFDLVADLSAFYAANPTAVTKEEDFEPDGTPYSMIESGGDLYVVEPNHGAIDRVATDGTITRVIDISATEGHIVPTAIAEQDGRFYVGNLSVFPVPANAAQITVVTPDGEIEDRISGFTAVLGVAFDDAGRLYVLETTTVGQSDPVPGTGKVLRVDVETGNQEEIASGLTFPTGMTMGDDGSLYVSNFGFGFPPGAGQIVKVEVPD
jgi:sugar lactone lactonase YvrE